MQRVEAIFKIHKKCNANFLQLSVVLVDVDSLVQFRLPGVLHGFLDLALNVFSCVLIAQVRLKCRVKILDGGDARQFRDPHVDHHEKQCDYQLPVLTQQHVRLLTQIPKPESESIEI